MGRITSTQRFGITDQRFVLRCLAQDVCCTQLQQLLGHFPAQRRARPFERQPSYSG